MKPKFALSRRLSLATAIVLSLGGHAFAANTADNIVNGQSDLTVAGTYSGGLPTTTSDVDFLSAVYAPTAFTLNTTSTNLSIGTLDDLDATQTLTIQNTTSGSTSTITLNGGTNSIAGIAAGDILYVASGGTLSIGTAGSGTLGIVLAASGNFDIAGTANIGSVISGTGFGFTKTGAGTLTLSGSNSYTGVTTVSAGTLSVSSLAVGGTASNLGAAGNAAGNLVLNGGTLFYTGNSVSIDRGFTSAGGTLNIATSGQTLTTSGAVNVNATSGQGFTVSGPGTLSLTGTVNLDNTSGNSLDLASGSTLTTSGTVTNPAGNLVFQGGTLNVTAGAFTTGNVTALGNLTGTAGSTLTVTGGLFSQTGGSFLFGQYATSTVNLNGGTFKTAVGFTTTTAGETLNFNGGTLQLGASVGALITSTANITMNVKSGGAVVDVNSYNATIGNALINYGGASTGGLTVKSTAGGGTLTLSGANTYTGNTLVSAGTLALGNALALQDSAIDTSSTGTITVTGYTTPTFGGLVNGGNLASVITSGYSAVTGITLNPQSGITDSYSGVIANGAANMTLTKSGAGTQVLSGANTYSGATTVSAGTLESANSGALSSTASVTVNNAGSTLAVNYGGASDYTQTQIGTLLVKTTFGAATTAFAFDTTNATSGATYTAALTQAAGLTKLGANTLTLSGASTYSGATTVSAGTLQAGVASVAGLSGAFGLNSAVTLANTAGVTLALNNFNTQIGSLAGGGTTGGNVTLGSAMLTLGGSGIAASYAGAISGTGGLVMNATGTQTLTGTSNYTGATTVNSGTLAVNGPQAAAAVYILNNGATLTSNQALSATNVVYANTGTSTFTDSVGVSNVLGGNGDITFTIGNSTTMSNAFFNAFGGVATWGSSITSWFRFQSPGLLDPFGTLNFGTGSGGIYDRDVLEPTDIIGAIAGGTSSGGITSNSVSGAGNYIIGSANSSTTYSGQFGTGGTYAAITFVKVGTGTLTVNPTTAWNNGGGTYSFNGGTLQANYTNTTTGVLNSTDAVSFGGGSLYLLGKTSATTAQTTGNVTVNAGGGSLIVNPNGGTSTTLTLGTLAATAAGGTFNLQPANVTLGGGTATITTTTAALADGTYGARLTYGGDWAASSGSTTYTLAAYTGYNNLTTAIAAGTDTTDDYLNNVGSATLAGSFTTNSLKITNTGSQQLAVGAGNTLTLTNGGLLFTGSAAYNIGATVGDGTLKSGTATNSDLVVQQLGTGNLTINSVIANGTGASTLTVGGFGTTILAGTNTYTGATYLNGGIASISADANLGAVATGAQLNLDGGTLQATATFTLDNAGANKRAVTIGGGGGTFDVTGGNNLTVDGVISTLTANQYGPLVKTDTGTLTLSGTNTYGGATIISGGVLSTNSLANGGSNSGIGSAANLAGALVLNGGTLQYTGGTTSTDHTFTLTQNGGGLDASGSGALGFTNTLAEAYSGTGNRTLTLTGNNTGANTLAAPIGDATTTTGASGTVGITKTGAGEWVLSNINTYSGNTTINNGTLALTAASGNPISNSSTITVASGGTLNVSGLTSGTLVLGGSQTLTGGGTVTGGVSTLSGSTITANSGMANTLTISNGLTLANGSVLNFGLNGSNPTANLINVSGGILSLPASASSLTLNLLQPGTSSIFIPPSGSNGSVSTYDLFQYASLTGGGGTGLPALAIQNKNSAYSYALQTATVGASNYLQLDITQNATSAAWAVDANGNWSNSANWTNAAVPKNAGDAATFGTTISALRTVTLDAAETAGSITFTSPNSYVISGANTLTLNNQGAGASVLVTAGSANSIGTPVALADNTTVTVNSATSLGISGAISNASTPMTLTLDVVGTFALSGSNSYGPVSSGTVGTYLSGGGTLQLGTSTALGAGDLSMGGSGTLQAGAAGLSMANVIALGGGVAATVDTGANTFTLSGAITDNAGAGGGTSSLVKTGTGTLVLSGINNYGGGTTITNGTVQINSDSSLGASAGLLTFNGGTLQLAATIASSTRNYSISSGQNATVDTNGSNLTQSGVISSVGTSTGTVNGLVKNGAGTLSIGGTNTFTGQTVINAGTLALGNALALQDSTLNYNNQGGTLSFGTLTAATLGGLSGSQGITPLNASSANVTLTVGNNNASTTYSGAFGVSGGSLTKVGTGTLILNQAEGYTGATTTSGGTLEFAAGSSVSGTTANITNGTLLVNGGTLTASAYSNITVNGATELNVQAGTVTFNGGLGTDINNSNNTLIAVTGGTLNATYLTLGRLNIISSQPTAGLTNSGLYVNGGTVNISGNLNLTNNVNSSTNVRIDSGSLTVGGTTYITLNNTGRWTDLDVEGGTFTSTETSANGPGIQIGGVSASAQGILLLHPGGTITTNTLTFGDGTQTSGSDVFSMAGGTLYVGAGGIVKGGTGAFTSTITLAGGTIAATANWSSPMGMTLSGTTTFQAADSGGTAHNITLSGVLTGTGAALTKTGGGTLTLVSTLTQGNSYSGLTTINGGTLNINSEWALGGAVYGGLTFGATGGTLQYATTLYNNTDITQNSVGAAQNVTLTGPATIDTNGNNITFADAFGNGGAGSFTKVGAGMLTLSGSGTYTGATTISAGTLAVTGSLVSPAVEVKSAASLAGTGSLAGSVTVDAGGHLAYALAAASGAQTAQSITGSLTFASGCFVDLTAATKPAAGTYVLATATGGISGPLPTVNLPSGVTGTLSVSGTNLQLAVTTAGYASWAASKGLTSANNGLLQDPNNNGIPNILEYVLNGDPLNPESPQSILPTQTEEGNGNLVFTYYRLDESTADTTQIFEYGTDLAGWTDVTIPTNSGTVGAATVTITLNSPGTGIDTVVVSVPTNGDPALFGRLKVTQP